MIQVLIDNINGISYFLIVLIALFLPQPHKGRLMKVLRKFRK